MERLWAVVVTFIVAVAGVPTYLVLMQSASPSTCNLGSTGPPPVGSPVFGIAYESTMKQGATYWANFSFESTPTSLTVDQLTLRVTQPNGSISGSVSRFVLWNDTGHVIASANGTTSVWIEGSSVPVPSIEAISVVSGLSLTGDSLQATLPRSCGGIGTAVSMFG